VFRKEWPPVQRIVLLGLSVLAVAALAQSAPVQPQAPTQDDNAVGVLLFLADSQVTSVDVSFPAVTTMNDIQSDLKAISQWTGWNMTGRPAENSGNSVSVHSEVSGAQVDSILNDAVWPIVGALARHPRLGVVVMGAPVATARLTIENSFVRLEQSGGQGVQSYQAFVKSTAFRTLDELRAPAAPGVAAGKGGGGMALAWMLVLIAAIATGVAVYMFTNRARQR
jgi:hypothetical protein